MKRTRFASSLALLTMFAVSGWAAKPEPIWTIGKVVRANSKTVNLGEYTDIVVPRADSVVPAYGHSGPRYQTTRSYLIEGGGYRYVVFEPLPRSGFRKALPPIPEGVFVPFCIEGSTVIIKDLDGKIRKEVLLGQKSLKDIQAEAATKNKN